MTDFSASAPPTPFSSVAPRHDEFQTVTRGITAEDAAKRLHRIVDAYCQDCLKAGEAGQEAQLKLMVTYAHLMTAWEDYVEATTIASGGRPTAKRATMRRFGGEDAAPFTAI